MDKEKIIAYQQKIIDDLELRVKYLTEENGKLNDKLEELSFSLKDMRKIHDSTLSEYMDGLKEISELKQELTKSLHEVYSIKNEYNNDMQNLLKKLKRNNKKIKLYCSVCGNEIKGDRFVSDDDRIICMSCMDEQVE